MTKEEVRQNLLDAGFPVDLANVIYDNMESDREKAHQRLEELLPEQDRCIVASFMKYAKENDIKYLSPILHNIADCLKLKKDMFDLFIMVNTVKTMAEHLKINIMTQADIDKAAKQLERVSPKKSELLDSVPPEIKEICDKFGISLADMADEFIAEKQGLPRI